MKTSPHLIYKNCQGTSKNITSANFSSLVKDCVVLRAEPAASHGHLSSKENSKLKIIPHPFLWNTCHQERLVLQSFPMIREMEGIAHKPLLMGRCDYLVWGPWDTGAELKCFAWSSVLCNFMDSYSHSAASVLFTQPTYQ